MSTVRAAGRYLTIGELLSILGDADHLDPVLVEGEGVEDAELTSGGLNLPLPHDCEGDRAYEVLEQLARAKGDGKMTKAAMLKIITDFLGASA